MADDAEVTDPEATEESPDQGDAAEPEATLHGAPVTTSLGQR